MSPLYIKVREKVEEKYHVEKFRNGDWRVMRGNRIISMHSLRWVAEKTAQRLNDSLLG